MAAATSARLATIQKSNPADRYYDRTADAAMPVGTLAGFGGTSGRDAVSATLAQTYHVAGVCLGVTGRDGVDVAIGDTARISEGVFGPFAQTGTAITAADIGEPAFVADNQTVQISGTSTVCAGIIVDVTSDGVWLDIRLAVNAAVDARALA